MTFSRSGPSRPGLRAASLSAEVVAWHAPDIIIGSWCGKKRKPAKVRAPGPVLPMCRRGRPTNLLHEIKSSIILQPGPAALTDGLTAMQTIIEGGL